jgi:T5orf172 domain
MTARQHHFYRLRVGRCNDRDSSVVFHKSDDRRFIKPQETRLRVSVFASNRIVMREERKAQQEMERERAKLEKERQHYENALEALMEKGDEEGANRVRDHLNEVAKAMEDVDYRAANIRAGYVYVISNVGSFGEKMVKIGMTRRLDPTDRVRELSDASVPFNFDVHALFFSKDAVGIESAMHDRLAHARVNAINHRWSSSM